MPGFVGTTVPAWIDEAVDGGLRTVCLYGSNITDRAQTHRLCRSLRGISTSLLIAVDEEGGDVTRLHFPSGSPEPGNAVLGRLDDVASTRRSAARIGADLAAYGIGLDLAPVVDVNSADDNPVIGTRSFGADPEVVARHTVAYVEGLATQSVAACAKHFPGHGDTHTDSHLDQPVVLADLDTLHRRELVPFRAAIEAGVATVMTSHILVPALDPSAPATFSEPILQVVLREELGFTGVVVTDALDMAGASATQGIPTAAVRALAAGADLLCLGSDTTPEGYAAVLDAIVAAVDAGVLDPRRLQDAAVRVAALADVHSLAVGDSQPAAGALPSPTARADVASATIAGTFSVSPSLAAWRAGTGPVAIVQVDTRANLAVGPTNWGPAALGATIDPGQVPTDARVAVVGRGIGVDHPARAAAAAYGASGHPVVLVECGWPFGDVDVDVDVATYSGSLSVAAALVELLTTSPREALVQPC